ncbi:SnoaL-like domain-containing protein [Portibacter marinus]|uniref:SnoaL-like domain-containing protein n=1 Tax=Portibacter marinus TaxID=2898660 RepID=UPI001F26F013|nr:SnoaL-like domain-containing protein [Portibacter marinus]
MNCKQRITEMNKMMAQGKVMEAFEKYYAEDCEIIEKPTGEVRKGKDAQRKAIKDWFEMTQEHHGGSIGAITSDEDSKVTMVQSTTDVTMKGQGRMKMEEVAVQHWNDDGQIVKEEFYYQLGPPPQMG